MRTIKYISQTTGRERKVKVGQFNVTRDWFVMGSNAVVDSRMLEMGFVRKNRKGKNRKSNRLLAQQLAKKGAAAQTTQK